MSIRFNLTAALACQAKRRPDVFALCTGGAELGYGGLARQRIGWPGISRRAACSTSQDSWKPRPGPCRAASACIPLC